MPRRARRAYEHAVPRVLSRLVAEVPVALDQAQDTLAGIACVIEELLRGLSAAEHAELWFGFGI